jgi:hypothetical protein
MRRHPISAPERRGQWSLMVQRGRASLRALESSMRRRT